jgi:hypothetical protein
VRGGPRAIGNDRSHGQVGNDGSHGQGTRTTMNDLGPKQSLYTPPYFW